MNKEKSNLYWDLYRYYGNSKKPIKELILTPPEIKWLKIFRNAQEKKGILKKYWRLRHWFSCRCTGIQINYTTNIGKGFRIGHFGRIIINTQSVIGINCNISTGVVIGEECRGGRKGCPTIGNCVYIGPNAVIVGNITIGNNVLIAANAFVNCDVPSNSIVIGNPCSIHSSMHATDGYMNNLVE